MTITAVQIDEEISDVELKIEKLSKYPNDAEKYYLELMCLSKHYLEILCLAKRGLLVDEMAETLMACATIPDEAYVANFCKDTQQIAFAVRIKGHIGVLIRTRTDAVLAKVKP